MPLDKRDAARLWDMLTYATETLESLADVSFAEYLENRTLRLATERRLEIIGEAARRVSQPFQENHPGIPWRRIISFRHVLAHEYGEIKHEMVFQIVSDRLSELVKALEPLVPPPPKEDLVR